MNVYSYIEECYCTFCGQNVGVEYIHREDGTKEKRCISRSCADEKDYLNKCRIVKINKED